MQRPSRQWRALLLASLLVLVSCRSHYLLARDVSLSWRLLPVQCRSMGEAVACADLLGAIREHECLQDRVRRSSAYPKAVAELAHRVLTEPDGSIPSAMSKRA